DHVAIGVVRSGLSGAVRVGDGHQAAHDVVVVTRGESGLVSLHAHQAGGPVLDRAFATFGIDDLDGPRHRVVLHGGGTTWRVGHLDGVANGVVLGEPAFARLVYLGNLAAQAVVFKRAERAVRVDLLDQPMLGVVLVGVAGTIGSREGGDLQVDVVLVGGGAAQ